MKNLKFGLLGFGILSVVAVFLPYATYGSTSISLWEAGKALSTVGESALPVYLVMLTGLVLIGLTGFAVKQKALGRGLAAGALVTCGALLFFTLKIGAPPEGIVKAGGLGAYVLVFGGLLAFLCSLSLLIKPDRHPAMA